MFDSQLKTKIVATIGPASWDPDVLKQMVENGMQVARINASFADYDEIQRVTKLLRSISDDVTVLLDTMGHKIRVTGFEEAKDLKTGSEIILIPSTLDPLTPNMIQITYDHLADLIEPGATILIDDGSIVTRVTKVEGDYIYAKVEQGGILQKRKTVNTPGTHLHFPELTEKDKVDIQAGIDAGVDLIAASFVRDVNDVRKFREAMGKDSPIKLIAKIEDVEGVENFDDILEEVDGIMVARGDLGVEVPMEKVPHIQKEFIKKCRIAGKPIIVATQMLESMREHMRPTRAEVADVANAVLDGTDAVMLSAETSTGKYPAEAVKVMARIAREAEKHTYLPSIEETGVASEETDILCEYASEITDKSLVKGVIVLSHTGKTVLSLSRHHLAKPIWAVVPDKRLARQLMLSYGVRAASIEEDSYSDRDSIVRSLVELGIAKSWIQSGDKVLVISGLNYNKQKKSRILEIIDVDDILPPTETT